MSASPILPCDSVHLQQTLPNYRIVIYFFTTNLRLFFVNLINNNLSIIHFFEGVYRQNFAQYFESLYLRPIS